MVDEYRGMILVISGDELPNFMFCGGLQSCCRRMRGCDWIKWYVYRIIVLKGRDKSW